MGACWSCIRDCLDLAPPINEQAVDLTHFTLHRVLGKGGFGKVQVIESRRNGDYYALKSMDKQWLCTSSTNVKSVWLERHIMVQLRSPFLVHAFYAFQDEHQVYLVMDFQAGGDLHFLLHSRKFVTRDGKSHIKPLPEAWVKFYMAEILLGLEELHSAGIVNRDLKPENCLLDADGHVRISDFGLAGDLNAESDGTTVGSCGTNGYISREALANMPYSFEPDVYAYGVTMYELLHGQIPDAYDDPALLNFNPQLSDSCVQLLTALLAHDPAHRIGCDLHARERWNEVKEHAFFSGLDWNLASRRGLTPPFRPEANIANCDPLFELEDQLAEKDERQPHTHESTTQFRAVFRGWDYHTAPRFHTQRSQLRHRRADGSSGGGEEEGEEDTASGTPSRERMDLGDGVPVVPGAGGRSNAVSSGLEEVTIDADSIEMTAREQRRQPVSIQPSVIDATARPTAPSSPSTPIKDQLSSSPAPAASPEALHFASAAGDILDASEAHPSETKIVKRQSHMAGGSIPSRGWPSAIFHASDPPSRRSQSEFHTAASSAESAAPHVMSAPLRSNRLQATSSMDLDEAALDQITMDVDDRYDPESRVEEVPGLFD